MYSKTLMQNAVNSQCCLLRDRQHRAQRVEQIKQTATITLEAGGGRSAWRSRHVPVSSSEEVACALWYYHIVAIIGPESGFGFG